MKQLDQSVIDAARRYADGYVAHGRRILTKDGAAETMPERIAWEAEAVVAPRLDTIMKSFNDVQARGRLDEWLERKFNDIARRDVLFEFVAQALERGELPPKKLCEYAAKVLRQVIKGNVRGTLLYRDTCIASLLISLESWGFPLFPNRAGRRRGQTYGCDIVIEAFKKIGIHFSEHTVEQVWNVWKRRWADQRHRFRT
jgi:hypothetical protein